MIILTSFGFNSIIRLEMKIRRGICITRVENARVLIFPNSDGKSEKLGLSFWIQIKSI